MDESSPRSRASSVSPEYRALHKYLRDRYAETVVLTFMQIEDLLGTPLPEAARVEATWWTDPGAGEPSAQSQAWIAADRTASPNLLAHIVRFERRSA
jgi:hypothetical protein